MSSQVVRSKPPVWLKSKPTATMSEKESKWKRTKPTKIYDYNYKVSEGYYKPQTDYIDYRSRSRNQQPPDDTHLSYAERYSYNPWYGCVRGLPYDENKAEINKPLIKLGDRVRGSSLVREMREDEKDDIPLNIRAFRRKKRMEEEEEKLGTRPKTETLASSGVKKPYVPKSDLSLEIKKELQRIDDQMNRAIDRTRSSPSFNLDSLPSRTHKPIIHSSHHEDSYTLPSGTKVKKSSHSYESKSIQGASGASKPPFTPRSRNLSLSEESSSAIRQPRSRLDSFQSEIPPILTRTRRISTADSDDIDEDLMPVYTNRAARIREQKRMKESENLTESINKMVDKMRVSKVDPSAVYRYHKSLRASSLEPPPRKSRNRAKAKNFIYGVGKY